MDQSFFSIGSGFPGPDKLYILKKTEQLRFVPLTNFALCGIQVERCFVHGAQIKNRSKTGNFVLKRLDDNKNLDGEYI